MESKLGTVLRISGPGPIVLLTEINKLSLTCHLLNVYLSLNTDYTTGSWGVNRWFSE